MELLARYSPIMMVSHELSPRFPQTSTFLRFIDEILQRRVERWLISRGHDNCPLCQERGYRPDAIGDYGQRACHRLEEDKAIRFVRCWQRENISSRIQIRQVCIRATFLDRDH